MKTSSHIKNGKENEKNQITDWVMEKKKKNCFRRYKYICLGKFSHLQPEKEKLQKKKILKLSYSLSANRSNMVEQNPPFFPEHYIPYDFISNKKKCLKLIFPFANT